MIGLVGQDQITTFTSPVNGTSPIDANVVRGNDNTVKAAFNLHDADPSVHFQSSLSTARPPAGVPGRKWLDSDTIKVYYDDGAAWHEIDYLGTAGGTVDGDIHITGNVLVDGTLLVSNGIATPNLHVTDAIVDNTLTVGGLATFNGNTTVNGTFTAPQQSQLGNVAVAGTLTVAGAVALQGALTVATTLTAQQVVTPHLASPSNGVNLGVYLGADRQALVEPGQWTFDGRVIVQGALNANAGLQIGGRYVVGPTAVAALSFEAPVTRAFIGDGSGYSFSFTKRGGGVNTDVLTITDTGVAVLRGPYFEIVGGDLFINSPTNGILQPNGSRIISIDNGFLNVNGALVTVLANQATIRLTSNSNDAYLVMTGTATARNWRIGKDIVTPNGLEIQVTSVGSNDYATLVTFTSGLMQVAGGARLGSAARNVVGQLSMFNNTETQGWIVGPGGASDSRDFLIYNVSLSAIVMSITGVGTALTGGLTVGGAVGQYNFFAKGAPGSDMLRVFNGAAGAGVTIDVADAAQSVQTPLALSGSVVTLAGASVSVISGVFISAAGAAPEAIRLVAGGSGLGNPKYIAWYRPDNTTRRGYLGFASANDPTFYIAPSEAGDVVNIQVAGANAALFDDNGTAGLTRMYVGVGGGIGLQRVSIGAVDSGGVGYRVLRVAN